MGWELPAGNEGGNKRTALHTKNKELLFLQPPHTQRGDQSSQPPSGIVCYCENPPRPPEDVSCLLRSSTKSKVFKDQPGVLGSKALRPSSPPSTFPLPFRPSCPPQPWLFLVAINAASNLDSWSFWVHVINYVFISTLLSLGRREPFVLQMAGLMEREGNGER